MTTHAGPAGTEGLPRRVTIVEVGPRDGLQAEAGFVPTAEKIRLVQSLVDAGISEFEATSFVSPRAVPQLADGAAVIAGVMRPADRAIKLSALVPNRKGAVAAADAKADAMVVFMSASETHNLKNLNRTREQSLAGLSEVVRVARDARIPVQGAIATSFGCPFEGEVPLASFLGIARGYRALGIRHVTVADTTGMATPPLVAERCRALRRALPDLKIALHFHNTRGIGLVNVFAGLREGIDIFESSLGGLGGCPFAPGATGNVATEDLAYLLHECGIETGIDLEALCGAARDLERVVGRVLPGQVMKAGPRTRRSAIDAVRTAIG